MKHTLLVVSLILSSAAFAAGTRHAGNPVYPTYDGRVMAGYQGWFHNRSGGVMYPNEESVRIDMWPDVSEYEKTYPTGLKLVADWKFLVDEVKATSYGARNMYLHHRGKPLVVIWGVGFPDRPYSIRDIKLAEFMDFLKNDPEYGGCSVMLGVPTHWRALEHDCVKDAYLHELVRKADLVMP